MSLSIVVEHIGGYNVVYEPAADLVVRDMLAS